MRCPGIYLWSTRKRYLSASGGKKSVVLELFEKLGVVFRRGCDKPAAGPYRARTRAFCSSSFCLAFW